MKKKSKTAYKAPRALCEGVKDDQDTFVNLVTKWQRERSTRSQSILGCMPTVTDTNYNKCLVWGAMFGLN